MISKALLILFAAIVWLLAGANVLRIGVIEMASENNMWTYPLAVLVFIPFFIMFFKMVTKNVKRINLMTEEKILFLKFFSLKSYILIVCMMTFGIVLRNISAVPDFFIAFFYTGLGAALAFAGIRYFVIFVKMKTAKQQQ